MFFAKFACMGIVKTRSWMVKLKAWFVLLLGAIRILENAIFIKWISLMSWSISTRNSASQEQLTKWVILGGVLNATLLLRKSLQRTEEHAQFAVLCSVFSAKPNFTCLKGAQILTKLHKMILKTDITLKTRALTLISRMKQWTLRS